VESFNDIVAKEGKIDILVNCAGGSTRGMNAYLHEQSVEMIDSMLNTNLRGSILCSREAAKYMVKQRAGKIINIASVIGLRGKARFTDYAASKAGIIGYTSSLTIELGEFSINVNCISPGFIQRGMYTDEQIPYMLNSNYLKRVGTPEDIACAVAFLASSEADFITGQNLCVDGGCSLGLHGDD
jgi:3-oxoacyl-[acyl-carrier protein] reductase